MINVETTKFSYFKLINDEEWGLLEIIPNNIESKKSTKEIDIIKFRDEKNDNKKKLVDSNYNIRKNVLRGFERQK